MARISEVLSAIHSQVNLAAICIQKFVSSRVSASHDTCRTLLRPSSITKPRYPSLSVVSNGWRAASPTLYGAQPPTSLHTHSHSPPRERERIYMKSTGPMRRRRAIAGIRCRCLRRIPEDTHINCVLYNFERNSDDENCFFQE